MTMILVAWCVLARSDWRQASNWSPPLWAGMTAYTFMLLSGEGFVRGTGAPETRLPLARLRHHNRLNRVQLTRHPKTTPRPFAFADLKTQGDERASDRCRGEHFESAWHGEIQGEVPREPCHHRQHGTGDGVLARPVPDVAASGQGNPRHHLSQHAGDRGG